MKNSPRTEQPTPVSVTPKKPTKYTIEITIIPQDGDYEDMEMEFSLKDIPRSAMLKKDWNAGGMRPTIMAAEKAMGMDTSDFEK